MWLSSLRFSALGIEMGAAIGLCYWLGHWLEGRYGGRPWVSFGGLLLGLAVAARAVWREVKVARRQMERDDDETRPPGDAEDDRQR